MRAHLPIPLACALLCAACPVEQEQQPDKPLDPIRAFAYEESTDGLDKLFRDMLGAVAEDDQRYARHLAATLLLDQPKEYFGEIFGDELGGELYEEYLPLTPHFASFIDLMVQLHRSGQTRFSVERFTDPKSDAATGYQALALDKMKKKTPLYSVRAVDRDEKQVFHVWSFAYQKGFFRWIGKTQAAAQGAPDMPEAPDHIDLREYRVRDVEAILEAAADK